MSRYRRAKVEGGTYFFTVTLADRSSDALVQHVDSFRDAYRWVQKHHPFETVAICVLPDHLHAIWTLPDGDTDFSTRWSLYQGSFFSRPRGVQFALNQQDRKAGQGNLAAALLGTRNSQRDR